MPNCFHSSLSVNDNDNLVSREDFRATHERCQSLFTLYGAPAGEQRCAARRTTRVRHSVRRQRRRPFLPRNALAARVRALVWPDAANVARLCRVGHAKRATVRARARHMRRPLDLD